MCVWRGCETSSGIKKTAELGSAVIQVIGITKSVSGNG